MAGLALLLIIAGQLYYLPQRLAFWQQLVTFAQAGPAKAIQMAYQPADYSLLTWVEQHTLPDTTLLLLTASPRTYGDPSYVLYHRAMYHLYPRSVWWAAPALQDRYPAWWLPTDLSASQILTLAHQHQTSAILADGFSQPPLPGLTLAFDADTYLIFTGSPPSQPQYYPHQVTSLHTDRSTAVLGYFLRLLGAFLTSWFWGDVIVSRYCHQAWPFRLAAGWLFGSGIASLSTFLLLWLGFPLDVTVIILTLLGCILWLFTHRHSLFTLPLSSIHPCSSAPLHLTTLSPVASAFTFLLTLQLASVSFAAWSSPLSDWDAWVNWAGKANAIFIDQTISANLYHNPARLPTNLDYPLMLPLVEAWVYTWLGHIDEPALNLISGLFYGALLLLFYHAARGLTSPLAALGFTTLLATIPRLERPAHSGLADIPMAALVLLAFLFLSEWHKSLATPVQRPKLLLLCAVCTGLLPWLKNEGWLWWSLITLAVLLTFLFSQKHRYVNWPQPLCLFLISYLLPSCTLAFVWPAFLQIYGTHRFTFLPLTLATFWANLFRLPEIWLDMLTRLLNPYWNFGWLFAGAILVWRGWQALLAPLGWLILPIAGFLLLVSLSYVFSRFDPYLAHLNNSVERLMLQATPLLMWWLIAQCVSIGWLKQE